MSSLSVEDALAFREFLGDIPVYLRVRKGPMAANDKKLLASTKDQKLKVPGFTDSLSKSSIRKSLKIISAFFSWLVSVNYVTANPFAGVRSTSVIEGVGMGSTEANDKPSLVRARERRGGVLERVLPVEAISAIDDYLDKTPSPHDQDFHARARFIFKFALMTGLRISEMAAARRDDLDYIESPLAASAGGWILHVVGKGDKHREVPISNELVIEIGKYFSSRNLITLPCPALDVDKGTFLVGAYPTFVDMKERTAAVKLIQKNSLATGIETPTNHSLSV
jgi:integrase